MFIFYSLVKFKTANVRKKHELPISKSKNQIFHSLQSCLYQRNTSCKAVKTQSFRNIPAHKNQSTKRQRHSTFPKRRLKKFFRRFNFPEGRLGNGVFGFGYIKRVIAVSITKIRLFKPAKSRQRLYCEPFALSVMINNVASGSIIRLFHENE